jgi:signal transduction histidine kinase
VELARGAIARFSGAVAREGGQLRLHAAGSVVACVDAARFEQALGHLLSNAVRYGGGKPVDVTVETDGGLARVAVADHGIGVRPEDEERIFERFERAASWRHYGGLGLGLFLTRRIVEAHGGAIELEATGEQGATFVMTLPVEGPPEAETPRGRREAGERAGAAPPGPFDA